MPSAILDIIGTTARGNEKEREGEKEDAHL